MAPHSRATHVIRHQLASSLALLSHGNFHRQRRESHFNWRASRHSKPTCVILGAFSRRLACPSFCGTNPRHPWRDFTSNDASHVTRNQLASSLTRFHVNWRVSRCSEPTRVILGAPHVTRITWMRHAAAREGMPGLMTQFVTPHSSLSNAPLSLDPGSTENQNGSRKKNMSQNAQTINSFVKEHVHSHFLLPELAFCLEQLQYSCT